MTTESILSYLHAINYTNLISIVSDGFTIFVSIFAIQAFLTWKKQQKYSIQISLLMELEDNYEILFTKYIEEYHWFLKLGNTIENNQEISNKELNRWLIEEYTKKKSNDELITSSRKYEISYLRAKRFFPIIKNDKNFKKSYLDEIFNKHISKLNTNNDAEKIFKEYSEEFLDIKNNVVEKIAKLREKM